MQSMRNWFTFGTVDSRTYGVYITGTGTYNAPVRRYNNIQVPGRNGDLLGISTRLENVELTYPAGIAENLRANLYGLRSALLSKIGYMRLEDTYNSDEYRLAVYKGGLEADVLANHTGAQFEITFECKPQRYLKSGETATAVADEGSISNPTDFDSLPLIRVEGYGQLEINGQTITIAQHNNAYIDIDSTVQDCYCGSVNCNSLVTFGGNDFPKLAPGANGVDYANTITSVKITPNWWRV